MTHGCPDRARLWIRVVVAPGLFATATIMGLLAALLSGTWASMSLG